MNWFTAGLNSRNQELMKQREGLQLHIVKFSSVKVSARSEITL